MSRTVVLLLVGVVCVGVGVAVYLGWPGADTPTPRLAIERRNRVVIVGNGLAERMQYFGHFETLLHARFPEHELVVRNLGYCGDEAGNRPRTQGFWKHAGTLRDHDPDVAILCFGFNESFAGPAGLPGFEAALDRFCGEVLASRSEGRPPPRIALVGPLAHEDLGRPDLPDGKANNENLRLYTEAMGRFAARHGLPFVDLFAASRRLTAQGERLTFNGIHLTDEGDRRIAAVLDEGLFGPRPTRAAGIDLERLRQAVNEKNRQFFYDYRAVNQAYIHGHHKSEAGEFDFPPEFGKLRRMIEHRDRRVWAIARGETVPDVIDDSKSGTLLPRKSGFAGPIRHTTPEESLQSFTLAPGFEANLYASEVEFPDLAKPVALAFDARGRLWVSTMPSYPMQVPGVPVNDRVLILEDSDGDGKADKCGTFADGLYLVTGLALGDGGVYVGQPPNLVFLRDTDGDDRADTSERILMGFDTADTHRSLNTFRWGPGGDLYLHEGTFHITQVETPYGVRRNFNGGVYRYEPRTERLDVYAAYKSGNPRGHAFDRWGQDFLADASDGSNYCGTPFSCQTDYPRQHPEMKTFLATQWRPTCGCVVVSSRHFPDDYQGDYLLNNVMGFQGVLRYRLREDGSAFAATAAEPLLRSSDPNFRPVDLCFGPDGALYVCDWYNPIVGHIQYSQRDPARDKTHGRIYRITATGRPLVQRPKIVGATIPELLELLKAPEDATHEQARLALRVQETGRVLAALREWVAGLDTNDKEHAHHLLEALWVCQHHNVVEEELLRRLLRSPEPRARAAATRVLCCWRDRIADVLALLRTQVNDEHPRVRLEAVRALSFFASEQAREIAVESLAHPQDTYLEYALQETLATLDARLRR